MPSDLLEDILAFLYATSDKEDATSSTDSPSCPECGAELEADEENGGMRCPNCGEQSDC